MKESDLHPVYENWILTSYNNAWIYKSNDRTTSGVPDLHATTPKGSIWIELKHNHKLTPLQYVTLLKIQAGGGIALVGKDATVCMPGDYNMDTNSIIPGKGWDIKDIPLIEVVRQYKENI